MDSKTHWERDALVILAGGPRMMAELATTLEDLHSNEVHSTARAYSTLDALREDGDITVHPPDLDAEPEFEIKITESGYQKLQSHREWRTNLLSGEPKDCSDIPTKFK